MSAGGEKREPRLKYDVSPSSLPNGRVFIQSSSFHLFTFPFHSSFHSSLFSSLIILSFRNPSLVTLQYHPFISSAETRSPRPSTAVTWSQILVGSASPIVGPISFHSTAPLLFSSLLLPAIAIEIGIPSLATVIHCSCSDHLQLSAAIRSYQQPVRPGWWSNCCRFSVTGREALLRRVQPFPASLPLAPNSFFSPLFSSALFPPPIPHTPSHLY